MIMRCISPSLEILETRIAPAAMLALGFSNTIYAFDSDSPGTITSFPLSGIPIGENLIGIDFRPASGALYGIANDASGNGSIYLLNLASGTATLVAPLTADPTDLTNPFTTVNGSYFGMDFNPVPDRLRLVSDVGQNLRINVDTGLVITDGDLNGASPLVTGAAYTNSFAGGASTTLYGIDLSNRQLVTQNPPNNGTIVAVGSLGVNTLGSEAGFDILSTRSASGAVTNAGFFSTRDAGFVTRFYTVDLATGAATLKGSIGDGSFSVIGIAAVQATPAAKALTIDGAGHLRSFTTDTPNLTTDLGAITGVPVAESMVGFDFRPLTGGLYLVTKDAAGAGRLYTVNTSTAAATLIGTMNAPLTGNTFGVDFNPVADRLRIVSDVGQNLRVNVDTLAVVVDSFLTGAASGATAAAYTNSAANASSTTLYVVDATTDQLYIQNPPNNGTLVSVGSLGADVSQVSGLDIRSNGEAFATFTVGGVSSLYRIDLGTGAASTVGAVNSGTGGTLGLALIPNGTVDLSPTFSVSEAAGEVIVPIARLGGSDGTLTVVINTANLTGLAGSDYVAKTQVVTFAPGVTTQNVTISLVNNSIYEPTETFRINSGQVFGGGATNERFTTVTITDDEAEPVLFVPGGGAQEEGTGGTNQFFFFLSLTTPSQDGITFSYLIEADTADSTDLESVGVTQMGFFEPGFDSTTVIVTVVADGKAEPNETFKVRITGPGGAEFEVGGTIINDDPIAVTPKKVTYLDRDGDIVTVAISGTGTLDAGNFKFQPSGALGGLQLTELDLTATEFARGNVTITAKRGPLGGDGFVNVGALKAAGNDLGSVKVFGDLAMLEAKSVKALTVESLGRFGGETRGFGGPLISTITDDIGKLVVRTDIDQAIIRVGDDIGSVTIGGNLLGGDGDYSGSIEAGDRIGAITINGSIRGTNEPTSAALIARVIGAVKIRGDIEQGRIVVSGDAAPATAKASVALKSLSVTGSLFDADILVGFDRNFVAVNGDVSTGNISVIGDWIASDLAVGTAPVFDLNIGTALDGSEPLFDTTPDNIPARVAALIIRGQILGTISNFLDYHEIQAEQFGSLKVGMTKFPALTPGSNLQFGLSGDMFLRTVTL
jgi:hypothetical protein